jgi:hypothetical protein
LPSSFIGDVVTLSAALGGFDHKAASFAWLDFLSANLGDIGVSIEFSKSVMPNVLVGWR